jgi:hypothetical protein
MYVLLLLCDKCELIFLQLLRSYRRQIHIHLEYRYELQIAYLFCHQHSTQIQSWPQSSHSPRVVVSPQAAAICSINAGASGSFPLPIKPKFRGSSCTASSNLWRFRGPRVVALLLSAGTVPSPTIVLVPLQIASIARCKEINVYGYRSCQE